MNQFDTQIETHIRNYIEADSVKQAEKSIHTLIDKTEGALIEKTLKNPEDIQEFYDYLLDSETLYVAILENSDIIDESAQCQILVAQKNGLKKRPYPKGISLSSICWVLFLVLIIAIAIWWIKKELKECKELIEKRKM
ncbi:MAG: hypothetical protein HFJ34_02395 [Clostridia bacterium]|nr:hypothetical protein [Clostridia bacterium]